MGVCTLNLAKLRVFVGSFVFFCLLVGCILSIVPGSPIKQIIISLLRWVKKINIGTAGAALMFGVLQAIAVVLALPATPFNLTAGYMFTIWLGSLVSLLALDIAGMISFFVGRYLARSWAQSMMEKRPMFHAIDCAVGRNGFYIVLLVTLTPVFPSGLCFYLFGLSNVSFLSFICGTAIGLFPGTVALTYVGSLMGDMADIYGARATEESLQQIMWLLLAAGFTMLTIILLSIITKRALHYALLLQDDVEGASRHTTTTTATVAPGSPVDITDACGVRGLLTRALTSIIQTNLQLSETMNRWLPRCCGGGNSTVANLTRVKEVELGEVEKQEELGGVVVVS